MQMNKVLFSVLMSSMVLHNPVSARTSGFPCDFNEAFRSMETAMSEMSQCMKQMCCSAEEIFASMPPVKLQSKMCSKVMPQVCCDDQWVCIMLNNVMNVDSSMIKVERVREGGVSHLEITVPQEGQEINMQIANNHLALLVQEEAQQEAAQNDTDEQGEKKMTSCMMMNSYRLVQSLPQAVMFENPDVSYDKDAKRLTVKLLRMQPVQRDCIAVATCCCNPTN